MKIGWMVEDQYAKALMMLESWATKLSGLLEELSFKLADESRRHTYLPCGHAMTHLGRDRIHGEFFCVACAQENWGKEGDDDVEA